MPKSRERCIYELWMFLQDQMGPATYWPYYIQRICWTRGIEYLEQLLICLRICQQHAPWLSFGVGVVDEAMFWRWGVQAHYIFVQRAADEFVQASQMVCLPCVQWIIRVCGWHHQGVREQEVACEVGFFLVNLKPFWIMKQFIEIIFGILTLLHEVPVEWTFTCCRTQMNLRSAAIA